MTTADAPQSAEGIVVAGTPDDEILSPAALEFLALLQRAFNPTRKELLAERRRRQAQFDAGEKPMFLAETAAIREAEWRVAPAPPDLRDRRVEITGPPDRKMLINALNSGARVFMCDFEDAQSPTGRNVVEGQRNVKEAIRRTLSLDTPEKSYRLNENVAVLVVRPRGWHLDEKHLLIDGERISGSLFDFGLYMFHNAQELIARGSGPYFYLPKLESYREARLWAQVFGLAERELGIPHGTIRCTVLVETITAPFELEEILYELREYGCAMNAGRWDYIFSTIKKLGAVLPDRVQVTMTVPFMKAYTDLLVRTCHKRGAYAIGGMAAFIPSRKDPVVNEAALSKVREDKEREATNGFDGTWVAHPDLVPTAMAEFDKVLGDREAQLERLREDVVVTGEQLINFDVPGGEVTPAGVRLNVSVGVRYLDAWLRGSGAVAIDNLMEDAATAEISRAQIWSWVKAGKTTRETVEAELANVEASDAAKQLFAEVALGETFVEFLTVPAYERLGD